MAHNTNPERGGQAESLPAARPSAEAAVEPVHLRGPAFAHDLVRTLDEARTAVGSLVSRGSSDVTVSALTALVCAGSTPADALQAAVDLARQSPSLEPHGLALARVPGPVEGLWEWHITMTVSSRDPQTGEFSAPTHHADRPR
ncbi:hypothetical protein [Streptomyces sp. NPDC096153]|uniref:hypothetical protein n=1 Tax=Streptomyces sp. NPDC096153 TaxID=3155548 RepID=UPI0033238F55